MKKAITIINAILISAIVVGSWIYTDHGGLPLKATLSGGFLLLGMLNFVYALKSGVVNKKYPILMVIGLASAMAGDLYIGKDFIIGALLFAMGHLFFSIAYCSLEKPKLRDLVPFGVVFAVSCSIILFLPIFDFDTSLIKYICLFYALVISLMVGKAFSNLFLERSVQNIIIAMGCALFWFSDFMLVIRFFGNGPKLTDILCVITYFPAECLLAHSIIWGRKKQIKNTRHRT